MSESFSQWYETAKLEVRGIHTVSDMEKAYNAGVAAERERCAGISYNYDPPKSIGKWASHQRAAGQTIAAAIRKEAEV